MNQIPLKPIRSVSDLLEDISQFKSAVKEKSEHFDDMIFCYRGEEDFDWPIQPSIFRNNLYVHESEIIKEVVRQHPLEFPKKISGVNYFDALIKMQHFGVPTRLLDFTQNPEIALYFSCQQNKDTENKNGKIIIMAGRPNYSQDFSVCMVSYFAFQQDILYSSYKDALGFESFENFLYKETEFNPRYFYIPNFDTKKMSNDMLIGGFSENYIVLPLMNNERIKRQAGLFMIFGCGNEGIKYTHNLKTGSDDDILISKVPHLLDSFANKNYYYSIIQVESGFKKGIINQLDGIGINYSYVYPEISGTAKYLKDKYEAIERNKRFLEVIQTTEEPL